MIQEVYHTTEQDATGGEEHKALCEQLLAYDAIAFERAAVKHFGAAAGIMARQMLFWNDKGATDDFWIYKSRDEWYEDIGLKRKAQEGARKRLIKAGVMLEEMRLHHGRWRLYFRLLPGKLLEIVGDDLKPAGSTRDEVPLSRDERAGTRAGASPVLQKTTSEITSEEVSPLSPLKGAEAKKETPAAVGGVAPGAASSLPTQQDTEQQKGRGKAGADKDRSPRRRSRSRGGTPEAGIEAIRTHVHRKLGYVDLDWAVSLASRYDFTQDGEPPWWVMKELNNDQNLLKKIRIVVRRAVDPAEKQLQAAVSAPEGVSRGTGQETDSEDLETILEAEEFPEPDTPLVKSF
jgi:hypothetical protein